ncbi:MAG: class I SAM-dependent methyltransferase [Bacteroidales bacterium]|nr:class I SAM-dependent methyltransferase [Bacteroidales bacterium]
MPEMMKENKVSLQIDADLFNSKSLLLRPLYLHESAWTEHIPFAFWIVENFKPNVFVELGTHYGTSYFAFCQAVERNNLATSCYAIDTWEGDEHAGKYDTNVYSQVKSYNETNYSAFSRLLKNTFDSSLPYFLDKSIDLLHIDGFHTYEAVKHDFESWLPKMTDDGIVIFHDTNVKEREFGVYKFFAEISNSYQSFEFYHGYGLGIISLGKKMNQKLQKFFDSNNDSVLKNDVVEVFSRLGRSCLDMYNSSKYKKEISRLNGEQTKLTSQIKSNNDAVEKLKNELKELNTNYLDAHTKASERIKLIEKLRVQIEEKNNENDQIGKDRVTLKEELSKHSKALIEKKDQLEKLKIEFALKEKKINQIQSQFNELKQENQAILDQKENLLKANQLNISELNYVKNNLNDSTQQLRSKDEQILNLSKASALINEKFSTIELRFEEYKKFQEKQYNDSLREIAELKVENHKFSIENNDLCKKVDTLNELLNSKNDLCFNLNKDNETLKIVIENQKNETVNYTAQFEKLKEDFQSIVESNTSLVQENKKIIDDFANLSIEFQNQNSRLSDAKFELENKENKINELYSEIEKSKEINELNKLESESIIEDLKKDNVNWKELVKKYNKENLEFLDELEISNKLKLDYKNEIDRLKCLNLEKDKKIKDRFQEIAQLLNLISEKNNALEEFASFKDRFQLQQIENADIKNSLSWRVTAPIRMLLSKLTKFKGGNSKDNQQKIIETSNFFDAKWYLNNYSDVKNSGMSASLHYLLHGAAEGRNPGPSFNTEDFYRKNPNLKQQSINPLIYLSNNK